LRIVGKVFCLFLVCFLVISSVPIAQAATATKLYLQIQKYDQNAKSYMPVSAVTAGTVVRVDVKVDGPISNIGGVRLTLNYGTLFSALQNSPTCYILDTNGSFSYTVKPGKIISTWDTTSSTTTVSDLLFSYSFIALKPSDPIDNIGDFSLTVSDIYNSSLQNITIAKTDYKQVSIVLPTFDTEKLKPFQKIEPPYEIKYPDSLKDITDAETAFAGLSDDEISIFIKNYDTTYTNFINARNKYEELKLNAVDSSINTEIEQFRTSNAYILKLTVEKVKIEDDPLLSSAINMYLNLSALAKYRITEAEKKLLTDLHNKISELYNQKDAIAEAGDFINSYPNFWPLNDDSIKADLVGTANTLDTMYSVYETLSNYAKELLSVQKAFMDTVDSKVKAMLAENEKLKKIVEAVSVIKYRWVDLLSLDVTTVTISDENALKIMIKEIDSQTDEIKKSLAPQKAIAEELLLTIDLIKQQKDIPPESIEKPVIQKIKETSLMVKDTPTVIKALIVLLLISLLLMIAPAIFFFKIKAIDFGFSKGKGGDE
jgi:hypothetical protein